MAYTHRQRGYRPRPSSKTRFWYIGKRNKNNEIIGLLVGIILIGGGAWGSLSQPSQSLLIVLLVFMAALLFTVVAGFVAFVAYRQKQKLRALSTSQIDILTGLQFEHYVAVLLEHQGYSRVHVTQASGDYGVDVLASKNGQNWAVQAKRFSGAVGPAAIQEVFTGCTYYGCQRGMVVTTSHFTQAARKLAASGKVMLVDRDKLAEWIVAFQSHA